MVLTTQIASFGAEERTAEDERRAELLKEALEARASSKNADACFLSDGTATTCSRASVKPRSTTKHTATLFMTVSAGAALQSVVDIRIDCKDVYIFAQAIISIQCLCFEKLLRLL